jgi:hypothetical protein
MSTIRIETVGTSDLGRVYLWLSRNRGRVVQLGGARRLALGVPISGARAVIVAATMHDDTRPEARLGGVLRVLSNPTVADPVRIVFDGRALGGLERSEAEDAAADMLERISELVAEDGLAEEVA